MPRIANKIGEEQNKVGELTLPSTKTIANCSTQGRGTGKSRQIDRLNRTESPEGNPHKCSQLTFDKVTEAVEWSKDSLFNKWCKVAIKHRGLSRYSVTTWWVAGRFQREGIYVYLGLIPVAVWQKPTQHCKAIYSN